MVGGDGERLVGARVVARLQLAADAVRLRPDRQQTTLVVDVPHLAGAAAQRAPVYYTPERPIYIVLASSTYWKDLLMLSMQANFFSILVIEASTSSDIKVLEISNLP